MGRRHSVLEHLVVSAHDGALIVGERHDRMAHEIDEIGPKIAHGHERLLHELLTLEEGNALEVIATLEVVDGLSAKGDEEVTFLHATFLAVEHEVGFAFGANGNGEKRGLDGHLRKVYFAEFFHDEQVVTAHSNLLGIGAEIIKLNIL